uniref:NAD-dependent epimerase/dehydratase domain-containing protein n=1 Tax=Fibrocapsa japonica TaxID=94617 RepID=A0A7S2XZ15_9STRA|mmetsp:Transcript_24312/g.35363  ORF Transcript_24312/g.35363 Transcript_24312/m.35363 type:complete len:409 (+) Transcript_24312:69-1295(+)|eukprot:CAMPEP_0113943844 /NCGR_PEP_ID=MMETSP1339-20121228/28587_1 /TAXON_ID=94617 /ORGANISM="Fibrocapsa japonica" /LENGTH=408 /DNA_ID=CAMNT_0000948815 /DNA_START=43 /DNA_END=1269 /DNA_ORIENTATION=+ /assembly_acc=CAM_ASM_000762
MANAYAIAFFLAAFFGLSASFTVPGAGLRTPSTSLRARGASLAQLKASAALIVQNKGGGHGELGYHLAKILSSPEVPQVTSVTIINDGGPEPVQKLPFTEYGGLDGVDVIWADIKSADIPALLGDKTFKYVFDNYAKDEDTCKAVADLSKKWDVDNYVYVSSAGMYKSTDEVPMTESTATKETGQKAVEEYAASIGLPWTAFRPQYIYGPLTNKRDYLDWFFHRVCRDRDVPLPNSGDQFVAITHAADVASMFASVIGNDKAPEQVFNCASDRFVTYRGLVKLVAETAGKDPESVKIVNYDPTDYDLPKGAFPFRPNSFFVSSDKAKNVLGWAPKNGLVEDLKWYFEDYKSLGLLEKEMEFPDDDQIFMVEAGAPGTFYENLIRDCAPADMPGEPLTPETAELQKPSA